MCCFKSHENEDVDELLENTVPINESGKIYTAEFVPPKPRPLFEPIAMQDREELLEKTVLIGKSGKMYTIESVRQEPEPEPLWTCSSGDCCLRILSTFSPLLVLFNCCIYPTIFTLMITGQDWIWSRSLLHRNNHNIVCFMTCALNMHCH